MSALGKKLIETKYDPSLSIVWCSPSTTKGPRIFIINQQRLVNSRVKFQVREEPPPLFSPTIGYQIVLMLHVFFSFLLCHTINLPLLRRFSMQIFVFVTSNSEGIYRIMRQWNRVIWSFFYHQVPEMTLSLG